MDSSALTLQKKNLRAEMLKKQAMLTPDERRESDGRLFARFLALPQVARAKTILLYYGMGMEPHTGRLLAALPGKRLALPRCLPGGGMEAVEYTGEDCLVPHPKYGILEPRGENVRVEQGEIDLILVPGLAFDADGNRLGRGGGYYDRYLERFRGETVALCRDLCFPRHIPIAAHDVAVGLVLTETRQSGPRKARPAK